MKRVKRFDNGGYMPDAVNPEEERLKQQGLSESKDDKVGFFERLRMGNIDQEGSEAYNRFGAGRVKNRLKDEETSRQEALARRPEENVSSKDPMEEANNSADAIAIRDSLKSTQSTDKPAVVKREKTVEVVPSKPTTSPDLEAGKSRGSGAARVSSKYKDETASLLGKYPKPAQDNSWQTPTKEQADWRKSMESKQALENVYPEELLLGGAAVAPLKALFRNKAMKTADEVIPVLKRLTDQGIPIPEYIQTLLPRQAKKFLAQSAGDVTDVVAKATPKRLGMNPRQLPAPEKVVPSAGREDVLKKSFWAKGPKKPTEPMDDIPGMAKGGSVRGWGKARSARSAKVI